MKIKVGIVGYGTIGKRVADAVLLQDDMELVGVTARTHNFRIKQAHALNLPIYYISEEDKKALIDHSIPLEGGEEDLVKKCDVVIDCTPTPKGEQNKEKLYKKHNVKAIYQGGESDDIAQVSFNANTNYHEALNKDHVRVVSCNTTGLARVLYTLNELNPIKKVNALLVRRAADPGDPKKGPINAIVPELHIPSHHGPDVKTVMDINILTTAIKVPTTLMHMHNMHIIFEKPITKEEVIEKLEKTMRIRLISKEEGVKDTASIMEWAKDLGTKRGDIMDNCIWKDSIYCEGNECYMMQAIHQESDVIPENIDAIRAMMGVKDAKESMAKTNKTLHMKH
jgi:glyceraldehyde-3-phosphate dehydrogenase (NAD(P))